MTSYRTRRHSIRFRLLPNCGAHVAVQTNADLIQSLESQLVSRYGLLLPSTAAAEALGFRTARAYRQAIARGTLSLKTFSVPNRRGTFALAADVARWIADQYAKAPDQNNRPPSVA